MPYESGPRARAAKRMLMRMSCTAAITVAGVAVATQSTAAAKGKPPIKIMVIGTFTSGAGSSAFPEIQDGAQGAVNGINKAGGIDGRHIKLLRCDSQGDVNIDFSCGRTAVADHVMAIVGGFTLNSEYQAATAVAGIPDIGPYPNGLSTTSPLSFPLIGGSLSGAGGPVSAVADFGHAKTVVLMSSNAPGNVVNTTGAQLTLSLRGGTLLQTVLAPPSAADFTPYLQQAINQHPDAIIFSVGGAANDKLTVLLHQLAPNIITARGATTLTSASLANLGSAANGLIVSSQYLPPSYTANKYVKQWVAQATKANPNTILSDFNANGWAAVQVFAEAAREAKSLTKAAIIKVLKKGTFNTLIGPKVAFKNAKHGIAVQGTDYTRIFNTKVTYSKVENGQVINVVNGKFFDIFAKPKTSL